MTTSIGMKFGAFLLLVGTTIWGGTAAETVPIPGTVYFQNKNSMATPPVNAPISFAGPGPATAGRINGTTATVVGPYTWGGINAKAGLYAGPVGSQESELILLGPVAGFRTGLAAGYVDVGSVPTRVVPNVSAGSAAVIQIRAWDAGVPGVSSYEEAMAISQMRGVYLGKSALLQVTALGGVGIPPSFPAYLIGLTGFDVVYSESLFTAPVILAQPNSQAVPAGRTACFSLVVTGAPPLYFQWSFKGNVLAEETGPTLSISNVQAFHVGSYQVVITNSYGSVTSQVANLTVTVPPPGTIYFDNKNPSVVPSINAPISYAYGGPGPVGNIDGRYCIAWGGYSWGGTNARAGLYAGPAGSSEEQLVFCGPAAGFRSGVAAGFVDVGADPTRFLTNVFGGSPAVAQLRAWDAGIPGVTSYEQAVALAQSRGVYLGKSPLVQISMIGDRYGGPAPLMGLQPFSLAYSGSSPIVGQVTNQVVARMIRKPSGSVMLQFNTNPARTYSIQSTTNLVDWVTSGEPTASEAGIVEFEVPCSGQPGAVFYRAVER